MPNSPETSTPARIGQPRNRWGRFTGIPGNMRDTDSMRMAQRAGLINALVASQAAIRSEKRSAHA